MAALHSLTKPEIEEVIRLNDALPRRSGVLVSGSEEERALVKEMLEGGPPERRALIDYLQDLERQKLNELTAVMLWGRDAKESFESFEDTLDHCKTFETDQALVYITGKTGRLSQYLRRGMSDLGI